MSRAKIQALGITLDGKTMRWQATGYVDGVGWLETWGKTLVEAMEAWQAKADALMAERQKEDGHT